MKSQLVRVELVEVDGDAAKLAVYDWAGNMLSMHSMKVKDSIAVNADFVVYGDGETQELPSPVKENKKKAQA